MRQIPDSLDTSVVQAIDDRLAGVRDAHGVSIPWAIESGSRAWGFPSPDSDYDCRFLFVRTDAQYLSLWSPRDVIETPLDRVLDVNGWDLAKALRLISKGNATVIEWLRSPIVYRGDIDFRDRVLAFADEVVERGAIGRHYRHVALRQKEGAPSLKRFFYVLRPAAALRWLHDHPDAAVPPMDLPTLLAQSDVTDAVREAVTALIEQKAVTRELGAGTPPLVLQRFVTDELQRAERFETEPAVRDAAEVRAAADAAFRRELSASGVHSDA